MWQTQFEIEKKRRAKRESDSRREFQRQFRERIEQEKQKALEGKEQVTTDNHQQSFWCKIGIHAKAKYSTFNAFRDREQTTVYPETWGIFICRRPGCNYVYCKNVSIYARMPGD